MNGCVQFEFNDKSLYFTKNDSKTFGYPIFLNIIYIIFV